MADLHLEPLLARLGVETVREAAEPTRSTVMLRVPTQNDSVRLKWTGFIDSLLQAESRDGRKQWTVDISRTYYLTRSGVRYMWRLVVNTHGDAKSKKVVMKRIHDAVLSALPPAVPVDEFPLVGRVEYAGHKDPNKTKGAYGVGQGGGSEGHAKVAKVSM